ncbi:hypothetical protein KXV85_003870, partial [Aspergillus fumigatus]
MTYNNQRCAEESQVLYAVNLVGSAIFLRKTRVNGHSIGQSGKPYGRFRVKIWNLTAIAMALCLSACANAKTVVLSSGDRYRSDGLLTEEYRLGAGDKLRVIVYNEVQLSGEYVVDSQGKLSLPLVGDLD